MKHENKYMDMPFVCVYIHTHTHTHTRAHTNKQMQYFSKMETIIRGLFWITPLRIQSG